VEKFNEQNDLSIEVSRKTEFLLFEAAVAPGAVDTSP